MSKKFTITVLFIWTFAAIPMYGQVNISQTDLGKIEAYKKSIQIYIQAENPAKAAQAMNNIAYIYNKNSHWEAAIDYYNQSLELNYSIPNPNAIVNIHNNLAMLYNETGNYEQALKHFKEHYSYTKNSGDNIQTIESLLNIATAQKRLGKYREAETTLEKALKTAKNNDLNEQMKLCYGDLASLHNLMGNKAEAERYYNDYYTIQQSMYKKSLQNSELERLKREEAERLRQSKEVELQQTEKELSEIKDTIKYINERHKILTDSLDANQLAMELIKQENKNKELANRQLKREKQEQRRFLIFGFIVLLIAVGFSVQIWYSSRKIKNINNSLTFKNTEINQKNEEIITQAEHLKRAKEQIEIKHSQITASIEYAQLIQTAVLNPRKNLSDYIPDSFIWYAPRDVVSGDFYWYAKIDNKLLIAAGDCTGHGVPGGFLTMTGHNLLGQIVQHLKITDPATILNELEKEFSHALHQDFSDNMDGMDISILVLDPQNKKMHFSGAKSPLLLIANEELNELRPDHYSIGGISLMQFSKQPEKKFNTQTIEMPQKFSFFMHSDGPVDQFNKVDKERLMKHRFYNMISETNHLSAKEQKREIIQRFDKWRGETKQTDDLLLIGGKINNYSIS